MPRLTLLRRRLLPPVLGILVAALGSACAGRPVQKDNGLALEGRVSWAGSGIGGAQVLLLRSGGLLSSGLDPVASVGTAPDGTFRLVAPPDSYVLLARLGQRFSFYGRNPVRLNAPQQGLNLPLVEGHGVVRKQVPREHEVVSGRVLRSGRPVQGARVNAYLDLATGLRGPGYAASEPTGPDGTYSLSLLPGTYLLAARKRVSGSDMGPLAPGDLFGVASEVPLVLHEGETAELDIELVELPGRDRMARVQGGFAALKGTAVDAEGKPVAGLRVCLYDNRQMINQPLVVSDPTPPDGTFSIETTLAGVFFLGARDRLGGPPLPGERVGFYVGAPEGRVELAPGTRLRDLKIVIQVLR